MRRIGLLVLLLMYWNRFALAQDTQALVAESNPAVQEQLTQTYDAFLSAPPDEAKSNCEAFQELQKLKEITTDNGEIVKQLAIFVATTTSEEDVHVIQAMGILQFLDLPASAPIRVLAPYLDSENEKLRRFAQMWFYYHDSNAHTHGRPPLGSVNYHDYMAYVRSRLNRYEEIPEPFIKFIYERHPGKALLVFAYANRQGDAVARLHEIRKNLDDARQGREKGPDEIRQQRERKRQDEIRKQQSKIELSEILLAEHVISNAIWLQANGFPERFQAASPEAANELAKLANREEWWARLYVAWIMRKHPELRQADVVQRLSTDSDNLVSEAAKSAEG